MSQRMYTWWTAVAALFFMLAIPAVSEAQLSPADKREAEAMVVGVLYLRLDAPCDYGRMVPMLVVSPDSADAAQRIADLSAENLKGIYWQFGPNDSVRDTVLRWGITSIRIWSEGARGNELMIDFVSIKTLDDFKKAFDRTFSRVPLQDAHPDWAPEIRKAVAERRVMEGMTKEQAAAVIGSPLSVETSTADGVEVEIWRPRQQRGAKPVYSGDSTLTRFPVSLKFQGGKLITIEAAPAAAVPPRKK